MKQNNPRYVLQNFKLGYEISICVYVCYRFILRNHILQTAIEHAEKGDYSEVSTLYLLVGKQLGKNILRLALHHDHY